MGDPLDLHRQMDAPFKRFDRAGLGPDFAAELRTTSRLWFQCGYRPGIAAYLNFFLLRAFIETHDTAYPPRFRSWRSMAESFYRTDLFIREVTDSGATPTGGISSPAVRATLRSLMRRHQRLAIPVWMMTYFGFSLVEAVEKVCAPLGADDQRRHLAYMTTAYRIMGVPFSTRRELMETFSRDVEQRHVGSSRHLERHTRNILLIGETIEVSSRFEVLAPLLPDATRPLFREIHARARPPAWQRAGARLLGRFLMKRAIGQSREAVPVEEDG